jgi:RsiW-degrading membrane proteinase PrsW (M82 family)
VRGRWAELAESLLAGGPYVAAAFALVLAVPFLFVRLVLGRHPFRGMRGPAVARFLLLGFLSAFAAVLVNSLLDVLGVTDRMVSGDLDAGLSFGEAVFVSFVLAGLVEEGAKLLAVGAGLASVSSHPQLVIGGLLVGVGFGLVENAFNVYDALVEGAPSGALAIAFVRSFVLLHPIATALAADGLGRRVYGPPRWRSALWRGFGLAVLVHGLWDLAVFWQPAGYWIIQGLLFPWLVWWGGRRVSDLVLRISGRAPARVAGRRPAWLSALLVAFGLVHADVVYEATMALASGAAASEPITFYGLLLPASAAPGLAVYNLALSLAGLVGAIAAGRTGWGAPLYAAGAFLGLLVEIGVIGVAAATGQLVFEAGELSDDLLSAVSGWLVLRATRVARSRPPLAIAPASRPLPATAAVGSEA